MRCIPRLVVLKKGGTTGSIYPFPAGRCSVGGLPTCDICIPGAGNSHLLVIVDKNNQAHIVNVNASSVELNGAPVENEAFVNHKDLIKIGAKSFRFEWIWKQKTGSSNAAEMPTDDGEPEGAMRESSTLENEAGDQPHTDQESHSTFASNGVLEPSGTPAASTSTASFLDQSVYKTPRIPPEEFVSPLTTSGSNDTSRRSQGASTSKGSLKQGSLKGSGQSTNPVKRLSWSDTPHRSDQEPPKNLYRSRGRRPNSSLFATPSQGLHAEDDLQAGPSNGQPSDSVLSTTSTPLIDEPRIRAMRLRSSLANAEDALSAASTSVRSDSDASMVDASSLSHSRAKEQRNSPMKKSVRARPSLSRNCYSSSGEDSFDQVPDAATPKTSKGIFAASTPVVLSPRGAGHMSNGVKTPSLSHQATSNATVSEAPHSSRSFLDTSTGSSGVLSFAGRHSSSATPLRTPRANVPRKSANVSSGSTGHRSLRKTPKQSLGSGNMNEVDPNEELLPDALVSSAGGKVASQNHAENGQAMESKVPSSLEQNSSTPWDQHKSNESGLSMQSSLDGDEQAQKGPRASRTPCVKGRGVEAPAKKGREDNSFEDKNVSHKANHSSHTGSSKKSSGGLEELESPSVSSRISRARALTESNESKEAAQQEKAQESYRRSRSRSLSAAVEKGGSSDQEADCSYILYQMPSFDSSVFSPDVTFEEHSTPARMTRASCTPSAKANKDVAVRGDRKSLFGAAKKSGSSNGLDEASGVGHSESSMDLSHGVADSVTSKKIARVSSGRASASIKDGTEPEVAQKGFRGRSSSTKASKTHEANANLEEKPSHGRMSASRKDEAEEIAIVKKSRKSSTGNRASNRPEEDEAQEQKITTALEEPSRSAVAGSPRGSRTPASANDGTQEKGTAAKNARESSAGRRAASERALNDGDSSEQNNSGSLPATTPKTKRQQSFGGPSASPVRARSSRGSRMSASGEDKAEAAEKDSGKKSTGTSGGGTASNRPELDGAQEQGNMAEVEKLASFAVAVTSRGSRTPAVKSARESSAVCGAASDDHAEETGGKLPATTPESSSRRSIEEPPVSPVNARSTRGSRTPAFTVQDTVVEKSRASTSGSSSTPKSKPEDEAQEDTTTPVPGKTPKVGRRPCPTRELVLLTPSVDTSANHTPTSTRTTRQALQQEISPRGSRRGQVGHTGALNVTEKNPKAGNQQIKNEKSGATSSTKRRSQDAHLNLTGSSSTESPKAVPKSGSRRSANTLASKDTVGEDETLQDFVDVASKTPQNKSGKDPGVSTAQSPMTEQPNRVSRRISAAANVGDNNDLQDTASRSQSFMAEQPTRGSRASRGSGSKREIEKQTLQRDTSTAQSPTTEQESNKGSPVKAGTTKGGDTPVLKKPSGENIALTQESLRKKSVATPVEVQGEKSHVPELSPRATRSSSTPVLKKASPESGTSLSEKEAGIVEKDPCSSCQKRGQESNLEPQQSDVNTEQLTDSVSKRRRPRHEGPAGTDPGHLGDAEGTETETSAKKSQKGVAKVSFGNGQIADKLATPEAATSLMQSRTKRATASKKQTATPDKRQQDEAAATHEMTTPQKRGKRALASQLDASENQQDTEENTPGARAKRKRGGRPAALDPKVDQEGSSTKVTDTAAPESEPKAEGGPSGTPAKKRRGRPPAAIKTSSDQGGTVEDPPVGKTRGKRAAAPKGEANTEESMAGVPEKKKRGGRAAAASLSPKADQSGMAEGSSGPTMTTQASVSGLNSAEDTTDVPAKRKRGGRIAASTSGPKADKGHLAEGKTTKASGTELNSAEDTGDVPAKRKRGGRAAAPGSIPNADLVDMAGASSTGITAQALGSEPNPAEDAAVLPAKRKRGGRVAPSASGPKVDQTDITEISSAGKTAQASASELNSAQDTADVPAKRKRGGRGAASTSCLKVSDQDDVAESSSTSKTKAFKEASGTSRGAEAKGSSRAARTASSRQKKTAEAEAESVPGEHPGKQAARASVDAEEEATGPALGRGRRRGAGAAVEPPPPTASTPKKGRGRRAKPLDTIADEETGEPAAGTSVAATELRTSKRAARRKV